jgi:hypothetical protein
MTSYPAPAPPYVGPPKRHSGHGNKPINRIVMHGTVSPCERGGARKIAAYFRSDSAGGSAHYIVDPGEAVQSAYDDLIAWHAPPNKNSIGVELCDPVGDSKGALPMSRWDGGNHADMLGIAARLVAALCLAYDVPAVFLSPADLKAGKRGLCEHSDVSQAFGQSSHWDLGNFPRATFLKAVKVEMKKIASPEKTPRPKAVRRTRVDKARDLLQEARRRAKNPERRKALRASIATLPKH